MLWEAVYILYFQFICIAMFFQCPYSQVEVCTVFACVMSNTIQGTTSEAQPQGLSAPDLQVLSARGVKISWSEPQYPNGILLRYGVYRRNHTDCTEKYVTTPCASNRLCYVVSCVGVEYDRC